MTILETLENDIRKANGRMTQIRIEQKVLEKEYDLTNEKKWELEGYREKLKSEAEEALEGIEKGISE